MVKKKIDDEDDDIEPEDQEDQEDELDEGTDEEEEGDQDNVGPADPPRIDDEPPKPEKVGNIDSIVFLKEYARDINRPYTTVATKLGIAKSSAHDYLRRFLYFVRETLNDSDFPRRVKFVLNKNVPEKYMITDDEIKALKPLLHHYSKVPLQENNNAQPYSQSDPAYSCDNMSYDPFGNPKPPQQNPASGPSPAYQAKNQEYANLSTYSRSQMMRWVLEKAPFIHYSEIEPFIALFETDECNLMMNPDTLYTIFLP